MPARGPRRPRATPGPRAPRPEISGKNAARLLLAAGAALVVIAATIFTIAGWSRFGETGRAVILTAITALTLACAPVLRRRGLIATAETVAGIGLALTLADGYLGLRVMALPRSGGWFAAAAGAGLLAVTWAAYGTVSPADPAAGCRDRRRSAAGTAGCGRAVRAGRRLPMVPAGRGGRVRHGPGRGGQHRPGALACPGPGQAVRRVRPRTRPSRGRPSRGRPSRGRPSRRRPSRRWPGPRRPCTPAARLARSTARPRPSRHRGGAPARAQGCRRCRGGLLASRRAGRGDDPGWVRAGGVRAGRDRAGRFLAGRADLAGPAPGSLRRWSRRRWLALPAARRSREFARLDGARGRVVWCAAGDRMRGAVAGVAAPGWALGVTGGCGWAVSAAALTARHRARRSVTGDPGDPSGPAPGPATDLASGPAPDPAAGSAPDTRGGPGVVAAGGAAVLALTAGLAAPVAMAGLLTGGGVSQCGSGLGLRRRPWCSR